MEVLNCLKKKKKYKKIVTSKNDEMENWNKEAPRTLKRWPWLHVEGFKFYPPWKSLGLIKWQLTAWSMALFKNEWHFSAVNLVPLRFVVTD